MKRKEYNQNMRHVVHGGMFEQFDLIRIINLSHRKDRRAEMLRGLKKVGLEGDPRVQFFDAIRPSSPANFSSIGAHGVYLSHRAIIEEAVSKDTSVLILEDDCDFAPHARDYVIKGKWDMFYGGYIAADDSDLQASDIIGAHMMGFSRNGAQAVFKYLRELRVHDQHPPIDGAYVWFRRAHPEVLTHFAVPPVGNQRPSRSDIEPGAFYNRAPILRDAVESIRAFRRRFQAIDKLTGKIKW